jgi:hypothetical protein
MGYFANKYGTGSTQSSTPSNPPQKSGGYFARKYGNVSAPTPAPEVSQRDFKPFNENTGGGLIGTLSKWGAKLGNLVSSRTPLGSEPIQKQAETTVNTVQAQFKDVQDKLKVVHDAYYNDASKLDKAGASLSAATSMVNLMFSPISGEMKGAEEIPGIGKIAKPINWTFEKADQAARWWMAQVYKATPDSPEKEKVWKALGPAANDIAALIAQLAMAKVGESILSTPKNIVSEVKRTNKAIDFTNRVNLTRAIAEDGGSAISGESLSTVTPKPKPTTVSFIPPVDLRVERLPAKGPGEVQQTLLIQKSTGDVLTSVKNKGELERYLDEGYKPEKTKTVETPVEAPKVETPESPLLTEARKYKSAEEFVKAKTRSNSWSEAQKTNPDLFNNGILRRSKQPMGAKGVIPDDVHTAQAKWQNYGQNSDVPADVVYERVERGPFKGEYVDKQGFSVRDKNGLNIEDVYDDVTGEWIKPTISNEQLKNNLLDTFSTKEGKDYLGNVIKALPKNPDGTITAYRIGAIGKDGTQSYTLSEGMAKTFSHQGTDIPLPGTPGLPRGGYKDFGVLPPNTVRIDPKGIKAWSPYDAEILVEPRFVQTKSQLTDIWKQAQGGVKTVSRANQSIIPEPKTGPTPSKIAESINAKAVEAKLTTGFKEIAGYEKIDIAEQAKMAVDIINKDIELARKMIRGEESLPSNLNSMALVKAFEEFVMKNKNADMAYELANSPHITGSSVAAQTLRLAAERTPDSATSKLIEIKKAREAKVKDLPKKRTAAKQSLKKEMEKNNLSKEELSFDKFLDSITC